MHQAPILRSHWKEYLLERVRIIVDQSQHSAKIIYKMVQKPAVDICLNAIYEKW